MILEDVIDVITNKLFYLPFVYVFAGIIIYTIIKNIIISLFNRQSKLMKTNKNRYKTLVQLLVDIIKFVIIFIVILSILTVYGVNVKAALAGLGIASVVVGLAFQDLFKDLIVGFSIILEDYFSV
jgi:small conductance mechanosensitive channel